MRTVRVGVVGAGAVGQSVAAALITSGIADRVLVASRTREQAAALAADLDDMRQAAGSSVRPRPCDVAELVTCDAVVIAVRAAFTNALSGDVRMGGAAANAPVITALAGTLSGYTGTVLVVTNPVDLMIRLFAEVSGCTRVFGIGSNLDTARYRLALAAVLGVHPRSVRGHVIGEHGDGAVICASATTVGGRAVDVPLGRIHEELRSRPGRIATGIGRTRAGPAGAVLSALRKSLALTDGVEELSVRHGDTWLGKRVRFTAGHPMAFLPDLDAREQRRLDATSLRLRDAHHVLRTTPGPEERTA
ncbi:NAD(P)-binding domain-containing protein [Streptomyces sp. SID3212]|uniref:lactate/malate family dehydrogenase n=1 Tax=Streptomyces sp. SID3212 TaxID=2690259 RepID=UPI00136B01E3|nr:NAD(P)-binding domain-containing protein [Streptomyces sp. SID3212]